MRFDAAILTLMCCFSFADPTSTFCELDTLVGCSVTKLSYKPNSASTASKLPYFSIVNQECVAESLRLKCRGVREERHRKATSAVQSLFSNKAHNF